MLEEYFEKRKMVRILKLKEAVDRYSAVINWSEEVGNFVGRSPGLRDPLGRPWLKSSLKALELL